MNIVTIDRFYRYKYKECGNNFTVKKKSTSVNESVKRFGLMMYLEGLGFSSIDRLLGVSHVAVLKWIRKYGKQLKLIMNTKPVKVIEMDELHSYIGAKKTIVGCGLQLIKSLEMLEISVSLFIAKRNNYLSIYGYQFQKFYL